MIVGPPALAAAVANVMGRDGRRARVVCIDMPGSSDARSSPTTFSGDGIERLTERVHRDADALLVIAPRRSTPRSVVGAPVVRGLPIGMVFADRVGDLDAWSATLRMTRARRDEPELWVVLAEWEERYLRRARRQARAIRAANAPSDVVIVADARGIKRRVRTWLACDLNGVDLLRRLDAGAHWVGYHGHANPQGLSGYFGVTARHLIERADARPIGAFFCWACRSLQREPRQAPFGVELVRHGRVASFLGSIASIPTEPNDRLSALADSILARTPATVSAFIRELDAAVSARRDRELDRVWRSYRLVGNPLEPLANAAGEGGNAVHHSRRV